MTKEELFKDHRPEIERLQARRYKLEGRMIATSLIIIGCFVAMVIILIFTK